MMRLLLILSLLVITVGFSAEPKKTVVIQTDDSSAYAGISSFEEDDESYDVSVDAHEDYDADEDDDSDDDYIEYDSDDTVSVQLISSEAEIDLIEDALDKDERD
tara:strand:- start:157 stop:468 length:312 start_codon:yes stop_codon:yes gene_type:complete